MPGLTRSPLLRYGLALLASTVALLLSLLFWSLIRLDPFLLMITAVMISAWYGGLGPGLVATLFGAVASAYCFLPPLHSLAVGLSIDILRLGVFLLAALFISSLGQARKRAEDELRKAHEDLGRRVNQRTAEISTANALLNQEIVEHKQAEEALRESEGRYRSLFDGVPVGLYRTTPEGQILDANPAMVEMLGYPDRDTLLAVNAAALYPRTEDRGQWQARLELEGVLRDFEHRLRIRDGTIIWVRENARAVQDSQGRVVYYEGTLEDITEHKKAGKTLHALYRASLQVQEPLDLRERLDRLLHAARDVLHLDRLNILLADPEGRWLEGVAALGTKDPAEAMRIPIGPEGGGIAQAFLSQQPVIWWDSQIPVPEPIRLQPPFNRLEAFRSRAFAILPLVVQGRAIGVLGADRKHSRRSLEPAMLEMLQLFATQAALAIEHARLYEAAKEEAQREAAIRTVAEALTGNLQSEAILETIIEKAVQVTHAEKGTLFTLDPETQELRAAAWYNIPFALRSFRLKVGESATGRAVAWRRPVAIPDVEADTEHDIRLDVARREKIRAILTIPMIAKDHVVGALSVHHSSPHSFSADEMARLVLVAQQAALVLENAQLYKQAAARAAALERLWQVGQALSHSLALPDTMDQIAQASRELLQVDVARLTLWDEGTQCLALAAQAGGQGLPSRQFFRLGEGAIGTVAANRRSLIVNDYQAFPARLPELTTVSATMAVPLLIEERLLGTLAVGTTEPGRAFTPEDLQFLELLAQPAAIAIENARLYEEATNRAEVLARLWYVGQALSECLLLPETLDRIVQTARDLLQVDDATLNLWDVATRCLTVAAQASGEPPLPRRKTVHPGEGLIGTVAETRRPLIVNDYQAFPHRIPEQTAVTAGMAVPLLIEERLLGTLDVGVTAPGRTFTTEDLQLLELLAQPVAITLENARLFEQVRAGRERLQTLSRRLVDVQEKERRSIARELHDEVGQILTGLNLVLEMATRAPTNQMQAHVREAQALINDLMTRVRDLSLDLRPPMLDDLGLLPALLWHLDRYTAQTQVRVAFQHAALDRRFPPEIETAAYRIAQEALTNVARHAGVSQATVRLWADQDRLLIQVEDQGAGFDPEAVLAGGSTSGLTGMRERATLLGGHLTVESAPGAGTRVIAELPLGTPLERREREREKPGGVTKTPFSLAADHPAVHQDLQD